MYQKQFHYISRNSISKLIRKPLKECTTNRKFLRKAVNSWWVNFVQYVGVTDINTFTISMYSVDISFSILLKSYLILKHISLLITLILSLLSKRDKRYFSEKYQYVPLWKIILLHHLKWHSTNIELIFRSWFINWFCVNMIVVW